MPLAHQRKKEPEAIRQKLLESALHIAADNPPGGLTIQSVATAAGVTKGGLLHHFPSKESLLESLVEYLLGKIDETIEEAMENDTREYGRFTRAYVRAIFVIGETKNDSLWNALSVSMISDTRLGVLWANWLSDRKDRHAATDSGLFLETIRLAADGVWLQDIGRVPYLWNDREKLFDQLIALTIREDDKEVKK